MFATQFNPIVAIAAQAKTAEDRAAAARQRAERIERERAAYFRSRTKTGQTSGAKALPAVATIH
jgi:hypothetical protein